GHARLRATRFGRPRALRPGGHRYVPLSRGHNQFVLVLDCSCIFFRKAEGGIFHFFSSSMSLPLLCQSVTVFAMNCPHGPSRSSSFTARPHGSTRIDSSGISKSAHFGSDRWSAK